jgi:hypothetical protein
MQATVSALEGTVTTCRKVVMEAKLRCTLTLGQFSSELIAVVRSYTGREFSLFVPKVDLDFDEPPAEEKPVEGWIRVDVLEEERGMFLVRLPQSTLENGHYVTVTGNQLARIPTMQEA